MVDLAAAGGVVEDDRLRGLVQVRPHARVVDAILAQGPPHQVGRRIASHQREQRLTSWPSVRRASATL